MAIGINAKSIDEVPEIMREFVTENNGVFSYDEAKAFEALKNERNDHRATRQALAPFKALNMNAEDLAKLAALGKTPDELSELITQSANAAAIDPNKLTEAEKARLQAEKDYKALKASFDKLNARVEESDRKAADAELRALCEGLIDQLPPDIDRDRARLWLLGGKTADGIEVQGTYKGFKRNAIGDIEEVNGLAPLEYLKAMGNALGYKKSSTPGKASPGNATLTNAGAGANFDAAKKSGNIMGMLENAPDATN